MATPRYTGPPAKDTKASPFKKLSPFTKKASGPQPPIPEAKPKKPSAAKGKPFAKPGTPQPGPGKHPGLGH